jgi:hypothetical protein
LKVPLNEFLPPRYVIGQKPNNFGPDCQKRNLEKRNLEKTNYNYKIRFYKNEKTQTL